MSKETNTTPLSREHEALAIVSQQLRDTRIISPRPSTNDPKIVGDMTYAIISRSAAAVW